MRHPDNTRDRALFGAVFSDVHRAAKAITYSVYVDDEPVRVTSLRGFSSSDAPAVGLDASVPWPLDATKERKSVRVELEIEGRRWTDYEGFLVKLSGESFGASTAGYWQGGEDSIKFGRETAFSTSPSRALTEMLLYFPYARRMVPDIGAPLFVRQGADVYPLMAPVSEGIDAVETEAGVTQKDSFLNEARVFPTPSIGGIIAEEEPIRWVVGREIQSFSADLKNQGRFRDVGMVHQLPNGKYEELVSPRPEVRYPAGIEPPPVGCTYYEELSTEETTSTLDARSRAASIAATLSFGGEFAISFTTPFIDPRIEDYDVREVVKHDYQSGATTLYRVLIESQERDYSGGTATYSGTGVILEQVSDTRPRAVLLGVA